MHESDRVLDYESGQLISDKKKAENTGTFTTELTLPVFITKS